MRWLCLLVLLGAVGVFLGAAGAHRESTRVLGFMLAAALVLADLWVAFSYLDANGGHW